MLHQKAARSDDRRTRIVLREAARHAVSSPTIANLRLHDQIRHLCTYVRPRVVLTLYEGHAWERCVWHAARQVDPTVLCAGTPKAVADEYRAAAERAGFKPAVLDLETASLGRALLDPDAVAQTSSAIMDIGARTTTVSIFDEERVLRLSIIISVGGEEFTRAVALGLSLREEEAEEQKKKFGFGKGAKKNPVLPILSQEFQDVVQEVKEFIGYYEKKTGKRVGEIVLAGGSALLPSVDAFLAGQIGRDVRIGNPFARLAGGKNAGKEDRPVLFANVIGLALRGERQTSADINLLAETREAKKTTFAIPAFSRLRFSMPRLSLSSLKKRLSGVSLTRTHAVIIALLAIALGAWSFLATKSRRLLKPGGPASKMARFCNLRQHGLKFS